MFALSSALDKESQSSEDDCCKNDIGLADAWMMRGSYLRQLRRLAEQDTMERLQSHEMIPSSDPSDDVDTVITLPSGRSLLCYESFLRHQNYYDDLKHVNVNFIAFGHMFNNILSKDTVSGMNNSQFVIQQEKALGKGGLCWDAAFILGEHMIAHEAEWNTIDARTTRVLELGAGTGLAGIMISKACNCHVNITDLPCLLDLMKRNVQYNFDISKVHSQGCHTATSSTTTLSESYHSFDQDKIFFLQSYPQIKSSKGTVSVNILEWGVESHYQGAPYDVIIGADIVASLYDPIALAKTLFDLSSSCTKIFISGKARLDLPHTVFETELRKLFQMVRRLHPTSRNRNPNVFLLVVSEKVSMS